MHSDTIDEIITIDNEDYVIMDSIQYENNNYYYAISIDKQKFTLLKLINEGSELQVEGVKDKELIKKLLSIYLEKEVM